MSEEIKNQKMKHMNVTIPELLHTKIKTMAMYNHIRMPEMLIIMIDKYEDKND